MRWNGFARSLLFAALAAAAFPIFALVADPILGWAPALSLYLVGIAAVYAAGLAPRRSRAVVAAGIASALGGGVLLLAPSVGTVAAGAALIVGVCRSGVLYRSRRARALVIGDWSAGRRPGSGAIPGRAGHGAGGLRDLGLLPGAELLLPAGGSR